MSRTLIIFLLRCWMVVWLPAIPLGLLTASHLLWGQPVTLLLFVVALQLPLGLFIRWVARGEWRPSPWLWRLSRRIVTFRSLPGGRVSLLFADGLDQTLDLHEVMRWSESDLDDLARRFKSPLRHRVIVVLAPSYRDLTADFGRPMGGIMLTHAATVVLAADCPLRESLRHELAHLFAVRWNALAPPLLEEGLAVWLQGTEQGVPIEEEAGRLIRQSDLDIGPLLGRSHFFSEAHQQLCYTLAGGFTGFLIRRFGWDTYRELYRRTDRWTFRARFEKRFGMSLERAWRRWHDETVAMEALSRRLQEDRLFN
jgi:hypothetical protein